MLGDWTQPQTYARLVAKEKNKTCFSLAHPKTAIISCFKLPKFSLSPHTMLRNFPAFSVTKNKKQKAVAVLRRSATGAAAKHNSPYFRSRVAVGAQNDPPQGKPVFTPPSPPGAGVPPHSYTILSEATAGGAAAARRSPGPDTVVLFRGAHVTRYKTAGTDCVRHLRPPPGLLRAHGRASRVAR